MRVPAPIKPGDRIRIIAPSGPFDRTLVLRGLGFLAQRYRVEFDWRSCERTGFLAGSDERRLEELSDAIADTSLAAIVAARGGYGLTRVARHADLSPLREHPRWLVGFSDFTALHVEAARLGVASLHAHNAAGLGRGDVHLRQQWIDALEHPGRERVLPELLRWHGGDADGVLFGGNLTLLFTCFAAGRLRPPRGAIWFLEDVTEAPYRIDRALTALIDGGAFDHAAGVLVGEFFGCGPGWPGVPVEDVLRERLGQLRIPVLGGVPAGHGRDNHPLHLGLRARIVANRAELSV